MKRKISLILTILLILVSITGCKSIENSNESSNIINGENVEEKKITIIMTDNNTMNKVNRNIKEAELYKKHLNLFIDEFKTTTGIEVEILKTSANTYDEYLQSRNTQLYLDEGPTLILIGGGESYQNMINESIALDVSEQINNYENIYESLRDNYYIPISMAAGVYLLNKEALDNLDMEIPSVYWTGEDFHNIMYKYYDKEKTYIIPNSVDLVIDAELGNKISIINEEGKSELAKPEILKKIESITYELFESGKFKIREEYNYENYYRMVYSILEEGKTKEVNDAIAQWQETSGSNPNVWLWRSVNSLNALETYKHKSAYLAVQNKAGTRIDTSNLVILPDPYDNFYSWGFIVNRNGKNIEEGFKFINYLLSDEAQLKVYTEMDDKHNQFRAVSFSYPVVKTIEDEILKIEMENKVDEHFIAVRRAVLDQIQSGARKRLYSNDKEEFLKREFKKLIVKIVFADQKYSSEEIMMKLKKFDNEMNLMFSE